MVLMNHTCADKIIVSLIAHRTNFAAAVTLTVQMYMYIPVNPVDENMAYTFHVYAENYIPW